MSSPDRPEPNEIDKAADITVAVGFVKSVARAYREKPKSEPTSTVILSTGEILTATFIDSYVRSAGFCFMVDRDLDIEELDVEEEVRRMLSGRREIYLNCRAAKYMIKIRMKPPSEEGAVNGTRDRLRGFR